MQVIWSLTPHLILFGREVTLHQNEFVWFEGHMETILINFFLLLDAILIQINTGIPCCIAS